MSLGNLYLTGLRGTGKTTVAHLLSMQLGLPWIDTDAQIQARTGKSIREIFSEEGEAYFRDEESAVVHAIPTKSTHIVSLGGGVVLREANRQWIRATGRVVWLRAKVETMAQRILADEASERLRPSLTGHDVRAEIAELSEQRRFLYEQLANLTVETDGLTPEEVCEGVVGWWRSIASSPLNDSL